MIELRLAYVWDCDSCGRENFTRGLVPTVQDMDAMRHEHGIESYDAGFFMAMPQRVTCSHCKAEFDTEPFEHD